MMHARGPLRSRITPLRIAAASLAAAAVLAAMASLAIGAPATPAATASPSPASTGFLPSRHGFAFVNSFSGSVLPKYFGVLGGLIQQSSYGLCGGMSFAAADYYLAGREPPRDSKAPADGTPLFNYIYSRQSASFGTLGAMGLKFVEWMQLPDDGPDSAHSRTLAELPSIIRTLSRGQPVILGLVLTSTADKGKAWDNHQVLAFSSSQPSPGRTEIRIYDSNFPQRDDVVISIAAGLDGGGTSIAMRIPGRRDMPIRGLFRMAYSPVEPPK